MNNLCNNEVDIIVPIFNEEKNIKALCQALKNQDYKNVNVVLIDNGSNDNTIKLASDYFSVIQCHDKGSYSARNFGIANTSSPIILFTDGDCLPEINWVSEMLKSLDNYDFVAGKTLSKPSGYLAKTKLGKDLAKYRVEYLGGAVIQYDVTKTVCSFPSCNIAIKRSVLVNIGGFENIIGADILFSKKVADFGFKCNICKDAVIYHLSEQSFLNIFKKIVLYNSLTKLSLIDIFLLLFLILVSPMVFVVYFIIIYLRRKNRALYFNIKPFNFAIFESTRLILGLYGSLKNIIFPIKRVY